MRTFKEWATEETDLFEMAVFATASGEGNWKLGPVEIQGPTVMAVLKKAGAEGLAIAELATGLLGGAKFRKAGSSEEFKSLEALTKEMGKDEAAVRRHLVDEIKDQLRKQKARGWAGKERLTITNNKWVLGAKAEEAGKTSSKGEERTPLFEKEPKAEEKKEEAPKAKRTKKAAPEAEKKD